MEFTKMHGIGNDFVIVSKFNDLPERVNILAQKICDRHFGVGADGLVFILPSDKADLNMRIINSDGSEAEQCGNAIRCVAKYAYEHGLVNKSELCIETLAGIQHLRLNLSNDAKLVTNVRVDMGEPVLNGDLIPTTISKERVINYPIDVEGQTFNFTAVSMGNPHVIIYVDDAINFDVEKWGPLIENNPIFPRKTNVEFVTVETDKNLHMRVWERGVGQTLACGTGACATAVATVLTEQASREVIVHLKGGDLHIEWNEVDNKVYMTGNATEVFTGKWII